MHGRRHLLLTAGILMLMACGTSLPPEVQELYDQLPEQLDYNVHVKPVLSDKCFSCHGPDKGKQKAGLRLDIPENAFAELPENPGHVAIDPGDPEESEVFKRIMSDDPNFLMPEPSSHLKLSAYEKALITKWIANGAPYKKHWAFEKPVKPAIPSLAKNSGTVASPVDNFVLAQLLRSGRSQNPQAPKEILLRRIYLDLTGLPPTIPQIDSFLNDNSPDAYEKVVDKLLASPHYGEKMAVDWLDIARFADSHGYTVDRIRDASAYRDWVINAYNHNLPYDQFIHQQLAGDLMPDATREMIVATAFNRIHPQNAEGGVIEEEFQAEYVVDRTNTFGSAFLGLTVGCAKCHDHKYDPISQKNYYEMFSFFNNVLEAGQISFSDDMPSPTILLPSAQKENLLNMMKDAVKDKETTIAKMRDSLQPQFREWVNQKKYTSLRDQKMPASSLRAHFTFDRSTLLPATRHTAAGSMKRETGQPGEKPEFVDGFSGKGLLLNGDTWLNLPGTAVFKRSQPFSIGIRVHIPDSLHDGVIFHKSQAERLFNYRGYHLYLRNNRLEISMAHTAPSNAICKLGVDSVPRNQWLHFTLTYDGSSKAEGLRLYQNGREVKMKIISDNLTKDILFSPSDIMTTDKLQPGLQVGAWWRGSGLKNGKVDDIAVFDRDLSPFEAAVLSGTASWHEIGNKPPQALQHDDLKKLEDYYFSIGNVSLTREKEILKTLRGQLSDSTENIEELMVMKEMPEPRQSYLLKRGNYDAPGEKVYPSTPSAVLPFSASFPRNRLGLAQWVTDKNNPLTARVAVNRIWQIFFGRGLVKTSEDFGNQGEMPSHPELLDWLSCVFVESGWDVKKLVRTIVMSATYQQSSAAPENDLKDDPDNRMLARGPAGRMTAEMLRDNALAAAGLLNRRTGGKSVKPYQPPGLWEINNTSYTQDTGASVYRRSLYVIIKRSVPNPTLSTFDAGSRSYCVARRQPTNTPLQALALMNDPVYMECAVALGERMSMEKDTEKSIVSAYRKLTGRTPHKKEIELLTDLHSKQQKKFRLMPAKARAWINRSSSVGNKKERDLSEIAANAVVCSTIMNSDASLSKR